MLEDSHAIYGDPAECQKPMTDPRVFQAKVTPKVAA